MNSSDSTYRRWNYITGWLMFLVSTTVYILTLEPTVSFWDCGEFILSAFRLQVGHPPGAPLFLMLGRIATLFAGGDTSKVALTMNILSTVSSGFTILFLFWTITHLVRKAFCRQEIPAGHQIFPILAAGITGSLVYTFSDTFWFSAVEGELYAMSSLVTALVFWAMLKWEEEADETYSGRWIILIAYMMGLGMGIHRLNLLAIPVIVFIYYFRKYRVTTAGILKTFAVAVFLLWLMVFVIMPGIPKAGGLFELFFVNSLGLPYNSGLLFYIIFLIIAVVSGIRYSIKKQKIFLNYVITVFTVILIGYSSYAMIIIRSSARPPMNQNDPSNIFSFIYYINMEQYGSSPKIFGNYYNAPVTSVKQVIAGYNKVKGRYEPYYRPEYGYHEKFETIFPRMYSHEPEHESAYKYWGKIRGRRYTVESSSGKRTIVCPTFSENLRFFLRYQAGFMYMRYFMWNFVGRQNDLQGNGNSIYGNWISGIKFIDNARLGDQDNIPDDLKSNPGKNTYYFLPLLLGLAGILWQYRKDRYGFWVVFGFFFMTGLAIVIYLNQYPNQPRERDYAYAGSFYAFAVWTGAGFMLVYDLIRKVISEKLAMIASFFILLLAVPVLMAVQNWDDHDRSGRYTARDIGANYLKSTDKNAILFTYGDNDSFPVWYVQDVESIRNDVRVVNLSYLQAGWYIEMMRQKAWESDPLPFSLSQDKYLEGKRNQLPVDDRIEKPVPLKQVVNFAGLEGRQAMLDVTGKGDYLNYIPAKRFVIEVDSATVLANRTVKEYFADSLVSPMIWEFTETDAFKDDLAIMDILATNGWVRPVYFSTTVPSSQYNGLEKFFVQEGLAYRIVPVKTGNPPLGEYGMIDPHVMYDNMMNKFQWGNAEDPGVYLDENNRRMFSNFKRMFGTLGIRLLETGDTLRAIEVTRKALSLVPSSKIPHDYFSIIPAEILLRGGAKQEGLEIINSILDYARSYIQYILAIPEEKRFGFEYPTGVNMQAMLDIYRLYSRLGMQDLAQKLENELSVYYSALYPTTSR
ncbi:MAG: glycosyltransferase family 117 protein [Bacteroidales bacterium]